MGTDDSKTAVAEAGVWQKRHGNLLARAYASRQREIASAARREAAAVREEAARIRAEAARVRDEGARTRDEAARVRDGAALVRDRAARARDLATQTREEAIRKRLLKSTTIDRALWKEILDLDRTASEQSHDAAASDRQAAGMDREAADKDRDAAERDRSAASSDRSAADKDREAAEKERQAADADLAAAESDRTGSEHELGLAEARLSRSEQLVLVGRIAGGVAHEINNPLNALLLSVAVLEKQHATATESTLEPLKVVRKSAERITSVIADMKAWLGDGDAQPPRQRIDLGQLVDGAVARHRATLEAAARLVVDAQPAPQVWGVRSRLEQVLNQLLLNAATAISGPASANEIRVVVKGSGENALVEVRDTGPGIAAEVKPFVLDPFFTADEGVDARGLGLALCERIVTMHGGTLTVESEPGSGAVFRVMLPGGDSAPAAEPGPTRRRRVLIIDDDEGISRSLMRAFAPTCDASSAANGEEGLAALLAPGATFDLVLCDLMMPVMNGMSLYWKLLEVAPQLASSMVFVTGGVTNAVTADFLAEVPNLVLQKPIELDRLLELLEERAPARG